MFARAASRVVGAGMGLLALGAASFSSSASTSEADPFDDPQLTAALPRRGESEVKLRSYLAAQRQAVQTMLRKPMRAAERATVLAKLRQDIMIETDRILYGERVAPGARAAYLEANGCAAWTDAALALVAVHSPLIEIGAGNGQWATALVQRHNADILAFDSGANRSLTRPPVPAPASNVASEEDTRSRGSGSGRTSQSSSSVVVWLGDERELARPEHLDRTLFLCYPPGDFSNMASRCLQAYKGDKLLYVGEGRGGVNGSAQFFNMLTEDWICEHIEPLAPFPGGFEKLFVLRRRRR